MKIGSLCTGYGGLDLAVEAFFNAKTIWCADNDKYATHVIEKRLKIPNYGDIKIEVFCDTVPRTSEVIFSFFFFLFYFMILFYFIYLFVEFSCFSCKWNI